VDNIQGSIDPLRNDIRRIEIEVNELYKTVYKGNGTPSLISQALSLEGRIKGVENNLNQKLDSMHKEMNLQLLNITSVVNEKFTNLSHQITNEFEHKKIKMEGSWKIKVAIISSVCALLASFLPTVLNFLSKLPR
jgi:coproporphyrinogen III oxidase-like Fe-S oxidoreductase